MVKEDLDKFLEVCDDLINRKKQLYQEMCRIEKIFGKYADKKHDCCKGSFYTRGSGKYICYYYCPPDNDRGMNDNSWEIKIQVDWIGLSEEDLIEKSKLKQEKFEYDEID